MARKDFPAPVGPVSRIGSPERKATRVNTVNQFVERGIARIDTGFEKGNGLLLLTLKATGERGITA